MNHNTQKYVHLNAKSLQSCPTLCNPMDCSPARLLSPWDSPGKDTGVGGHVLLQGIFPNLGLRHCRQILYQLSHPSHPQNPAGSADVLSRPVLRKAVVMMATECSTPSLGTGPVHRPFPKEPRSPTTV